MATPERKKKSAAKGPPKAPKVKRSKAEAAAAAAEKAKGPKSIAQQKKAVSEIWKYTCMWFEDLWMDMLYGSITSHYWWMGLFLGLPGTILLVSYIYLVPTTNSVSGSYVCPITINFCFVCGEWILSAIIFCICSAKWSSILKMEKEEFAHLKGDKNTSGVIVKGGPLIARGVFLVGYVQIVIMYLQTYLLPECNLGSIRGMMLAMGILWMICFKLGEAAKKRVQLPPYLHTPATPDRSFITQIIYLVRDLGP